MNVLVITNLFPNRAHPVWGIHVGNNVRALARTCTIRVVAPVPFVPPVLQRGAYARFAGIPKRDVWDGIPVVYPRFVVPPRVGRSLHGVLLAACLWPAVRAAVRDSRPDVILSYFAYPDGYAAVLLGRLFRLPVVVSCRGSDINRLARKPLHRRLISRALRNADAVVAVSEALAVEIRRLGVAPDRLHVIPNGVDGETFRPGERADARRAIEETGAPRFTGPLVVCVSRLSDEKGIDVLLRAWAHVTPPEAALAVVGDGSSRHALVRLSAETGVQSRVYFAGNRPHAEIPQWWGACDVAVLPSRMEGYPNAAVEALACGRPVVASDVGGVGEIVSSDELGARVPPEDPPALAAALSAALAKTWNADAIAAVAHRRTWVEVRADTEKVLEGAVRSSEHARRRERPARPEPSR